MGKIKNEMIQLESDVSNAISQLEKALDISIFDDEKIHEEILTNPTYLEFIQMYVANEGLSKFNSPKDVKDFINMQLRERGKCE